MKSTDITLLSIEGVWFIIAATKKGVSWARRHYTRPHFLLGSHPTYAVAYPHRLVSVVKQLLDDAGVSYSIVER